MAREIKVIITDDIDGSPDADTVVFGWDGEMLEIDLSQENKEKLRAAIHPFVVKARRHDTPAGGANKKQPGGKKGEAKNVAYTRAKENKLIRAWAIEHGYDVPQRGRVPEHVRDAHAQLAEPKDKLSAQEMELLYGPELQMA